MEPTATSTSHAPTEIWRLIFRFATDSDTSDHVDYHPFQPSHELHETAHDTERLGTCLALVRVSHHFRAVAAEFLYEDVRIYDADGLASLVAGLVRSAKDGNNFGSYVRRLELPSRGDTYPAQSRSLPFPIHPIRCPLESISLSDILRLCPRLEVLVRPCMRLDAQCIAFWASLVQTPIERYATRLLRLEWYEGDLDARFYGTHHSSRLRELVAHSPNLRYLFLSSDRPNPLADLSLPLSLHTLRLSRSCFHVQNARRLMPRLSLKSDVQNVPNFRNLVLHTTLPPPLLDFLATSGRSLRVLELAFAPQMSLSSAQMQRLLSRCPQLAELAYYVGAPEISPLAAAQCPSLTRIRLKVAPSEWSPSRPVLRGQAEVLDGPAFPALREVVLHDAARWLVRREAGRDLVRRMLRRGCAVRYEDGEAVMLPT
ncbi:hypothetical protein B0H15DRAFT_786671 [Mycena belliarum]|uniref:F-box domain-containing protein n=1 Tax=Mycena belliarum TaxID=1033014 RepID=A0AAD6TVV2_9AGAR|nr:hypothetical protein B0H15DRAFT_786671 [Mycena belliae]